jgi:DNA polymerase-3 subunit epsilon
MKLLIIDIETTGFLGQGSKIVEIGATELNTANGKAHIVFDSLCKEDGFEDDPKAKEAWIFQNSDLEYEHVLKARPFEQVKTKFEQLVANYPDGATAYNNTFDFGFLKDRGVILPPMLKDPMKIATNICKLPGKYGNYKWPKVEEAYKHFFPNENYIEKHRGADDSLHEARIVYELIKLGHRF